VASWLTDRSFKDQEAKTVVKILPTTNVYEPPDPPEEDPEYVED
jgi:hypothetical protein